MAGDSDELQQLRRRVSELEATNAKPPEPPRKAGRLGCGAILAIGFILVAAAMCFMPKAPEPPKLSNGKSEDETRYYAMAVVEGRLKDPESAEFGTIFVRDAGGIVSACGSVNAKNGFGGYTGDKSFIVTGNLALFASDVGSKTFNTMWNRQCLGTDSAQ